MDRGSAKTKVFTIVKTRRFDRTVGPARRKPGAGPPPQEHLAARACPTLQRAWIVGSDQHGESRARAHHRRTTLPIRRCPRRQRGSGRVLADIPIEPHLVGPRSLRDLVPPYIAPAFGGPALAARACPTLQRAWVVGWDQHGESRAQAHHRRTILPVRRSPRRQRGSGRVLADIPIAPHLVGPRSLRELVPPYSEVTPLAIIK
jgi:hypothetical protein